VATVHAVKVADGQGAGGCELAVMKPSVDMHVGWRALRVKKLSLNKGILSLIDVCIPNRCFQLE